MSHEDYQFLDGIPILGPRLILTLRPATRWTEFMRSMQDRTNRTLATAFDPTEKTGVVDASGQERVGAWVILYQADVVDEAGWDSTDSGIVSRGRRQTYWIPCWHAAHALRKYPFDLQHPPHVNEAMDTMFRYFAWTASENANRSDVLRADMRAFILAEQAKEHAEAKEAIAGSWAKVQAAAKSMLGSVTGVDAVKAVEARAEGIPAFQEARAAYKLKPDRANTFAYEKARRSLIVPNDGGPMLNDG